MPMVNTLIKTWKLQPLNAECRSFCGIFRKGLKIGSTEKLDSVYWFIAVPKLPTLKKIPSKKGELIDAIIHLLGENCSGGTFRHEQVIQLLQNK